MPKFRAEPDPFDLLDRGSREHYDDPAYYDQAYRRRRDDVAFYRGVARRLGGPILELGVGSGRVALPLCRDGHAVVGVDASRPMLERARALAADLPRGRLTLREGDMREVRLRRRFPLVIAPFNALMHLYEPQDVVKCFANVARHLAPDGRFVFDVRMPDLRELALDPDREYKCRPFTHPTLGRVRYTEQFRYDPVKQVQFVTMRFYPEKGRVRATVLAHRQFFPAELRALLTAGGLRLMKRLGDASGRPLAPDDPVQIIESALA
ncbi:MAG: class I SAM-dependent methyltransferase [Polyangiales bacterium]